MTKQKVKLSPEELAEADLYTQKLDHYLAKNIPHEPEYYIKTYGCQLNESDSEKMSGILKKSGYKKMTTQLAQADLILFNTCSIRENALDKLFGNLGEIKILKQKKPNLVVGVCGCMVKQNDPVEKIKKSFPFVDMIFGPQDIHNLPKLLFTFLTNKKKIYQVSAFDYLADDLDLPIDRSRKFRALVPIMYGCNNFCTYCVVPYTRGRERSRDFHQIIEQVKELVEDGYKEIMLLGQNVNSYGNDFALDTTQQLQPRPTFYNLLKEIEQIPNIYRVRFMTSHPKDLTLEIIDLMANSKVIEQHVHLPLQSGSDAILSKMNRQYQIQDYIQIANYFKQKIPLGTISTDIIVGFPGETEEDFEATLQIFQQIQFDFAFTFQYSKRPDTAAINYPDQVDAATLKNRFQRLLELSNRLCFESNQTEISHTVEVLIEGASQSGQHVLTGRTSSNRLVNFVALPQTLLPDQTLLQRTEDLEAAAYEGKIAFVKINKAKPFSLEGELISFL